MCMRTAWPVAAVTQIRHVRRGILNRHRKTRTGKRKHFSGHTLPLPVARGRNLPHSPLQTTCPYRDGKGEQSRGRQPSHYADNEGSQTGDGTPGGAPLDQVFSATFLFPAGGSGLILLNGEAADRFHRNFGEGLTIKGDSPDGPFELLCPYFYVRAVSDEGRSPRGPSRNLSMAP